MTKAAFISIEGVQGAGKSTVLAELRRRALVLHHEVRTSDHYRQIPFVTELRALLVADRKGIDGYVETFLSCALRREDYLGFIVPALTNGIPVITERFLDSTRAFAHTKSLEVRAIESILQYVSGGVEPSLTLLLDVDADDALARIPVSARHRIERESMEFHRKLRDGFLIQAKKFPQRIFVVDANQPLNAVFDECWQRIETLLI